MSFSLGYLDYNGTRVIRDTMVIVPLLINVTQGWVDMVELARPFLAGYPGFSVKRPYP